MIRRLCLALCFLITLPLLFSCALFEELDKPQEYVPYNYDLSEYIVLGEYRALSVLKSEVEPSEEDLKEQMEADFVLLTRGTDRPLAAGDTVNLNYTALFDGGEYDDDTEAGFFLTLGENALGIPGFDEGLIGAVPGDSVALDLVFPADYDKTPSYAGKAVSFLVTINYIRTPLPELTDELVSRYTTYATKEAYLKGITATLTEVRTVELLWMRVVETTEVLQYPEKEYKNYYTEYIDSYTALGQTYSMTLEEIAASRGMTLEQFYAEADRVAKQYLKEDMIVYAIVRAENLVLTEAEYKEAVHNYYLSSASDYYVSEELMEQTLGKEILSQQFLSNKVLDFIVQTASVTED